MGKGTEGDRVEGRRGVVSGIRFGTTDWEGERAPAVVIAESEGGEYTVMVFDCGGWVGVRFRSTPESWGFVESGPTVAT